MPVDRQELDRAIRAALNGPEVRDVRFAEYRFNVKPAEIERSGNTVSVTGGDERYISRRRGRPNDRIYYEFDRINGFVDLEKVSIDIERGGFVRSTERRYHFLFLGENENSKGFSR